MIEIDALIGLLNRLQTFTHAVVSRGVSGGVEVRLAYAYLVRLNRSLHAIALLTPDGHGIEILSLMRPIAEAAIRVRWVGKERDRAVLLIDQSSLDAGLMWERLLAHGLTIPEHIEGIRAAATEVLVRRNLRGRAELQVPSPEEMERRIWGRTTYYDMFFRRGSADVHASAGSAARAVHGESAEDHRLALHYALAAASLLLEASLAVIGPEASLAELRTMSRELGVNWDP